MADIIGSIFSGGVEGAGKGIASVINAIKGRNPEDAAKLQELLTKHEDLVVQTEADLAKAEIDSNVKLNDTAGQNIRAETQNEDSFVRRARPYFLYVITTCIALNLILPMFNHLGGGNVQPLDFSAYTDLFRDAFLGYTLARSVEKIKGKA